MKIAIFGATGGTGHHLLDQALAGGYEVRALVREPSKLATQSRQLTVVQGDVRDPATVSETMLGVEAVLCALGSGLFRPGITLSEGTGNIVDAMRAHNVRQVIVVTALGIGDSQRFIPAYFRLASLLLRGYRAEKERQEQILRASDLEWTVVRPSPNTKGPRTGRYRYSAEQAVGFAPISHADVADFMFRQLTSDAFVHRAVAVAGSNPKSD